MNKEQEHQARKALAANRERGAKLIQCEFAVRECRKLFAAAFVAGDTVTALVAAKRWQENVAVTNEVAKVKLK